MRYTVLTLFPGLLEPLANEGLLKQAREKGLLEIILKQLRDYAQDKHRTVDDRPYGGGAGMVLKVDVLEKAIASNPAEEVLLLTPDGTPFTQALAKELANKSSLTLVCGRYEGFDARVETLVTRLV